MKRCFIALICIFIASAASAQSEEYKGFLLDKFQKGKVIYKKNSQATESNFNYELIMEKMLFMMPDSTILELARPDIVSNVIIGSRVFEHVNNGIFYERVNVGDGSLYIRWKSRVISEKEGPYGSKRGTARIDNVTQTTSMGSVYGLKTAEDIRVEASNIYYIKDKNKFKRFDSFDSLAKQFKKNEAEIKSYVKENNLSFKNVDDVKKAVEYSFKISK